MKRISRLIYLVLIFISSCQNSPDYKANIENCLKEDFRKDGNEIEISNIEKVNGIEGDKGGYKTYTVLFKAKFKVVSEVQKGLVPMSFNVSDFEYEINDGKALLVKTDNGWVCQGVVYDMLGLMNQNPSGFK